MPFEEVLFVDVERKTLPFRQAAMAKVKTATSWTQFEAIVEAGCGLMDLSGDKEKADYYNPIKVVFIDSFTRVLYLLSEYLRERKIEGYSFWRDYSDILEKMLMTWKSNGRFIVFTALDEVVRDADSIDSRVIKVEGKKLEGKIESYFTIVLHTQFNSLKPIPEAYQFCTNTDGKNMAK